MGLFRRLLGGNKKSEPAESVPPVVMPRHVTGEEFDTVILGADVPAIVDFWAEWCAPCHAIAPAVETLATEFQGQAVVAKLNADDYPEILSRYGIMGIPTVIYFKDGREVDRIVGLTRYGKLKSKLEKLIE